MPQVAWVGTAGRKDRRPSRARRDLGRRRALLPDLSERTLAATVLHRSRTPFVAVRKPLHGLQLQKIDLRTIAAVVSAVSSDSGAATCNRVRASLSALFSWAMRQGLCDSNPIAGTHRAARASACACVEMATS